MSYSSRQRKRRYKRIAAKMKRSRTSESAHRWFLTVAKKPGRCSCCRRSFKRGSEIVYRHEPKEVRCLRCGQREPDSRGFRLSLRWERVKAKEQKNTTPSGDAAATAKRTTTAGTLGP